VTHRAFKDSSGVMWDVWDVVPVSAERRSASDRRVRQGFTVENELVVVDRRRGKDRRQLDTSGRARVRVNPGMGAGWLVFDTRGERRRLAPIPAGWETASEAQLEMMLHDARPSAKRRLVE
jgi:hypothetical protein